MINQYQRQNAILEHLDAAGACSYQDLARLLRVSEMTIRRDVDKLVRRGGVIKTLGGVQTARGPKHFYESAVQQRLAVHQLEKEQIAREAVQQVKPQQTIFLDGSTTCLVLARALAKRLRGLTVVTHSALVCLEFGRTTDSTILCLGGQFDPSSACCVGPTTEEGARRFFPDTAFLSTKGFLPEEGTFESAIATFRIKQIIAEQAARVVLLVDHSKFGQRALCKVLDIGQIDEVITDAGTSAADLALVEKRGLAVRVASADRLPLETIKET
jgi:DeoR/GlpR family transcriptional regulator of sugar metabolism